MRVSWGRPQYLLNCSKASHGRQRTYDKRQPSEKHHSDESRKQDLIGYGAKRQRLGPRTTFAKPLQPSWHAWKSQSLTVAGSWPSSSVLSSLMSLWQGEGGSCPPRNECVRHKLRTVR